MTKTAFLLLTALCAVVGAVPAAAAPTTIDVLPRESAVDAGQGAVVWSRYDETLKAYRLVVRRGGVNSLVPVAASPVAFDADLGSDAGGKPAVVYSRCATYTHDRDWRDRCDLYILSLATGAERKIAAASGGGASEFGPTLWRGELAWIADRKAVRPAVYHRSLSAPASRKSKRLPGVPRRACNIHNAKPCSRVTIGQVEEIELPGDKLAEIVAYAAGGESTELRLVTLRNNRARRIAFQNIGENNQGYGGLSFSSGKVAWFRQCFENPGCAGSGAYRLDLSDGRYERALDPSAYAGWVWTGHAIYTAQLSRYYHDCRPDGSSKPTPCLVARDDDPAWKRVAARKVL